MAREINGTYDANEAGGGEWMRSTDPAVTTNTRSYAIWVYPYDVTTIYDLIMQSAPATATEADTLWIRGDKAGDPLGLNMAYSGGGSVDTETANSVQANQWNLCLAVVAVSGGTKTPKVRLNGGSKVTGSTQTQGNAFTRTMIGGYNGGNPEVTKCYMNGVVAEIAIWNEELTDADMDTLWNTKCSPLLVRPWALRSYWPCIGRYSPEIDLVSAKNLTLTNAPAAYAHPPILQKARRRVFPYTAAAGVTIPKFIHSYRMRRVA